MPRYHFNLLDGSNLRDDEGVRLPSLTAARHYAAAYFGAAIKDAGAQLFESEPWVMEVTDCTGLVLFVLKLCAFDVNATREAPALKGDVRTA